MERVVSWKRVCFILIALLILQFAFLWSQKSAPSGPSSLFEVRHKHEQWWTPGNQIANLHNDSVSTLTAAQCNDEYPDLYYEIDRAVSYWKDRRHCLGANDVEISWRGDGALRILVVDNELRILETKGTYGNRAYRVRTVAFLHLLQRALWSATAGGERLPTVEAAIVVDDISGLPAGDDSHSVWAWTSLLGRRSDEKQWLIPDFGMYSAPATGSFLESRRRAAQHDALFIDKIPQAVWRGVKWTNEAIRGALLEKMERKDWANAAISDWESKTNIMPTSDMCKYAFLIHTEGRSYSGRLQFLLNCNSLPIIHDLEWTTHFYHLLKRDGDEQNYIPVKRDFSDLERKVKYYLADPEAAQRIITNSVDTFRNKYTSPSATSCYLRRLIQGYSTVSLTPEADRPSKQGETVRRRGICFDEWLHLQGEYKDEP